MPAPVSSGRRASAAGSNSKVQPRKKEDLNMNFIAER